MLLHFDRYSKASNRGTELDLSAAQPLYDPTWPFPVASDSQGPERRPVHQSGVHSIVSACSKHALYASSDDVTRERYSYATELSP
jgi:hypothetical protein